MSTCVNGDHSVLGDTQDVCPQCGETLFVRVSAEMFESLTDYAEYAYDGPRMSAAQYAALETTIKQAKAIIEGVPPRCENPNPFQPGLKCTQPEDHEGTHSADSEKFHHTWEAKTA